ncbi:hypothetical protein C4556_02150 [Candidatus Parcubacteria bacterium]|nr:MAG: hypothetical protein C4556_02150 [Candidatus Parcubacteria bacterium]
MESERLEKLEAEVQILKARNARVEAEKAWETSYTRTFSIAFVTYIVAAFVLYSIGVGNFFLGALVPAVGYILSTQSLPVIRRWWIKKFLR